jgi:hypothetical protein
MCMYIAAHSVRKLLGTRSVQLLILTLSFVLLSFVQYIKYKIECTDGNEG